MWTDKFAVWVPVWWTQTSVRLKKIVYCGWCCSLHFYWCSSLCLRPLNPSSCLIYYYVSWLTTQHRNIGPFILPSHSRTVDLFSNSMQLAHSSPWFWQANLLIPPQKLTNKLDSIVLCWIAFQSYTILSSHLKNIALYFKHLELVSQPSKTMSLYPLIYPSCAQ